MDYPDVPKFLAKVKKYCEVAGIQETTLCKYALGNQVFLNSVRAGLVNFVSVKKVEDYMIAHPPKTRPKQGRPKKAVEEALPAE